MQSTFELPGKAGRSKSDLSAKRMVLDGFVWGRKFFSLGTGKGRLDV
jgi:hypothetical protein